MAHATSSRTAIRDTRRTPAQWYCLLAGAALLLGGILGFFADSTFDTGDEINGGSLLGFEVNAIHNIVHIASGAVLLAAARKRASARLVALAFGLVYGLVALIGLIDGTDVLGIIPVNSADNVLHIALAALGIITGLISRDSSEGPGTTKVGGDSDGQRFQRDQSTTAARSSH